MRSNANAETGKTKDTIRVDTWERRVFYSVPARYLRAAREELKRRAGVSLWTIYNFYLNGKYPNALVRDSFRSLLKGIYEYYSELAKQEIEVELD